MEIFPCFSFEGKNEDFENIPRLYFDGRRFYGFIGDYLAVFEKTKKSFELERFYPFKKFFEHNNLIPVNEIKISKDKCRKFLKIKDDQLFVVLSFQKCIYVYKLSENELLNGPGFTREPDLTYNSEKYAIDVGIYNKKIFLLFHSGIYFENNFYDFGEILPGYARSVMENNGLIVMRLYNFGEEENYAMREAYISDILKGEKLKNYDLDKDVIGENILYIGDTKFILFYKKFNFYNLEICDAKSKEIYFNIKHKPSFVINAVTYENGYIKSEGERKVEWYEFPPNLAK